MLSTVRRRVGLLGIIALAVSSAGAQQTDARAKFIACVEADTTREWQRMSMAWSDETGPRWTNDSLRKVLIALADSDQAVRPMGGWPPPSDTAFHNRVRHRDSVDLVALRSIVARFGWPAKRLVGAKGADAAFLIAQHNAEYQHDALQLMRALPTGDVSPPNLAMLEDRVLVSDGKPQRYGTQLKPVENGVSELFPIEDITRLDERRRSVGLPPFDTYLCMMRAGIGADVKDPRRLPNPGATDAELLAFTYRAVEGSVGLREGRRIVIIDDPLLSKGAGRNAETALANTQLAKAIGLPSARHADVVTCENIRDCAFKDGIATSVSLRMLSRDAESAVVEIATRSFLPFSEAQRRAPGWPKAWEALARHEARLVLRNGSWTLVSVSVRAES